MFAYSSAISVAITVMLLAGCAKPDPLVAEYSSVGSGRGDGGWTLSMFASGKCKLQGPFPAGGRYKKIDGGYELETRVKSFWVTLLMQDVPVNNLALLSIQTNGVEYLLNQQKYKAFNKSGDTNLLRDELRRVR